MEICGISYEKIKESHLFLNIGKIIYRVLVEKRLECLTFELKHEKVLGNYRILTPKKYGTH